MTGLNVDPYRKKSILIIGAGVSGIVAGHHLKHKLGNDLFTIFEKSNGFGGTWRDNCYPGAACDVPSHLYSFSFNLNPYWSRFWAPQPEILAYFEATARKYGLYEHARFNTEVEKMQWLEDRQQWKVMTKDGDVFHFDVVISGVGQLNQPSYPNLPGFEKFKGKIMHSARWDKQYGLEGKVVACVGNGASAVQLVPEVAKVAKHLTVFQRSAMWITAKGDRPFSWIEKMIFRYVPGAMKFYRYRTWLFGEFMFHALIEGSLLHKIVKWVFNLERKWAVKDEKLQKKLTPDYSPGCKRVLITDDYFPAVQRPNCGIEDRHIAALTETGVRLKDGTEMDFDCLIFATGFQTTRFLTPMKVYGKNGVELSAMWQKGAQAYLGLTVSGFPNFFICYGPNTNLGSNSIIFMVECQCNYIMQCLKKLQNDGKASMDVKQGVYDEYNTQVQEMLKDTVWAAGGCSSWYKNEHGIVTNNWTSTTYRYWRKTSWPIYNNFIFA
eukprot:Clim_evm11s6 gene=Clim_evmTU11s6